MIDIKEKDIDICEVTETHNEIIEKANVIKSKSNELNKIADFFKIIGDRTRIKLLYSLFEVNEMCVCDISSVLNKSGSAVSHQLRVLRQADLVKYRKEGKVVYYSLNEKYIKNILEIVYEKVNGK
ncbi:ArsR/SmtB family transcription factor [Marinitoga lauensis]|uniref:ArsR/SmtB family transcription factor n=1 Tax=Marinitoga lauensis TaxID=2201189 RepID=UPI001013BACC|nr:metalloregulator ArsR/SmtB family transcription factor [Marinitoga lauensis]